MEKLAHIASKLGKPEEVLVNALKRDVMVKIMELEVVAKRMKERYGVTLKEFEEGDLLNKLGHTWEVEQNYYEWDRAVTELGKLKEILKSLLLI